MRPLTVALSGRQEGEVAGRAGGDGGDGGGEQAENRERTGVQLGRESREI